MAPESRQNEVLGDRYVLERELGRGGHGVVYRAFDRATGTPVAIKVLKRNVASDPQYAVRLWREAQSLAALWGESVVRVHGFAHDADGAVYMVMDLLEGETLEEHLVELEGFGDRMSAFEMLTILEPVGRALQVAHERGIVHRDVKPSNVFLVAEAFGGGVRLMDFGLAKIYGTETLTQTGMVAGSPSYIPPEIWRAEPFDHRADVYSLGALVFRCLAGHPPFEAPSPVELFQLATTAPRPSLAAIRPDLDAGIDAWIARALALAWEERFFSVQQMWMELVQLVMRGSSPSAERARALFG